jgi:hypothetical protein
MGSTSMMRGEAGVLTSPTAPPAPTSPARGGLPAPESSTSGGAVPLSPTAGGGVAVPVSSANESITTLGSDDLVRQGEARAPRSCCDSTTDLHKNITIKQRTQHDSNK